METFNLSHLPKLISFNIGPSFLVRFITLVRSTNLETWFLSRDLAFWSFSGVALPARNQTSVKLANVLVLRSKLEQNASNYIMKTH